MSAETPRRFSIRRLPNIITTAGHWAFWPWVLKDRVYPAAVHRFATHDEAIAAADKIAGRR